jgi:hypothetical protein
MEVRLSDHLGKGKNGFQDRGVEILGKRPEVLLEALRECAILIRAGRGRSAFRAGTPFSRVFRFAGR